MRSVFAATLLLASWLPGFSAGDLALERERWDSAVVNPQAVRGIDQALAIFERNRARYEKVSRYGKRPIPAIVIFCLHYRESDASFRCHASNGDPLDHPTRNVPRGRLPQPKRPVFVWEDTAIDAYYLVDRLGDVDWQDMGAALYALEHFNGPGYLTRGIPSPYLWSKTSAYERGKYVADGRFDRLAVDQQTGCAAILKRYMDTHNLTSL